MYKFLIDSDALIKISKAGFLGTLTENFDVLITKEIYEETVIEGKTGFYQDADKIESLVQNGKIKILKVRHKKNSNLNFGKGELSILNIHKKDSLIITDDLRFTSYMQKENIKSVSSAHLLLTLVKKGKINKNKAYYYLEKLKPFIRKEVYKLVKNDIRSE